MIRNSNSLHHNLGKLHVIFTGHEPNNCPIDIDKDEHSFHRRQSYCVIATRYSTLPRAPNISTFPLVNSVVTYDKNVVKTNSNTIAKFVIVEDINDYNDNNNKNNPSWNLLLPFKPWHRQFRTYHKFNKQTINHYLIHTRRTFHSIYHLEREHKLSLMHATSSTTRGMELLMLSQRSSLPYESEPGK